MDEFIVIGITDGSYTGKDGRLHKGLRLYLQGTRNLVSREGSEYNSEGYQVFNEWVPNMVVNESGFIPSVGDRINLLYNRYGNISQYKPI